jgi:hypothetical protein
MIARRMKRMDTLSLLATSQFQAIVKVPKGVGKIGSYFWKQSMTPLMRRKRQP